MTQIISCGYAGTLESSDVLIQIEPCETIEIVLVSSVEELYGDDIKALVHRVLEKMGITGVKVDINDKGALDYVIKARLQAALLRAMTDGNTPDWSLL
ncbi:MAG: citrate lyase acyl carrier protein [Campylobacterales bacterium]|nr:citrate lyase acyl carrier protein [Campylobacterales bacterium]